MTQGPTIAETEAMRDYMLAALHAMTEIVRASPVIPTSFNVAPGALTKGAAPYTIELAFMHRQRDVLMFADEHGMQVNERSAAAPYGIEGSKWARIVEARGILYGHAVRAWWLGYPDMERLTKRSTYGK